MESRGGGGTDWPGYLLRITPASQEMGTRAWLCLASQITLAPHRNQARPGELGGEAKG